MKTLTKTLILPAAALAALLLAPKADAAWRVAVGARFGPPVPAVRSAVVLRAVPYRVVDGYRYYRYCPGPGWVRVTYGWSLRPYPRAVWAAPYRGPHGYRVRGCWR